MSSTTGSVIESENYPTPESAVRALLGVLSLRPGDRFLEPCRGDLLNEGGAPLPTIFNLMPLPDERKDWCELRHGVDYLGADLGCGVYDLIVTNPPFSLTESFIRKSLKELKPDGTLIYLQRVNFLGTAKRVPFWAEVGFPDKTPVLVPRPRFVRGGTDSCEYCWYIWDRGGRVNLPPGLSHLIAEGHKLKLQAA